MTPGILVKTAREIGTRLRNSPVGVALADCRLGRAIETLTARPEHTGAEIIATVPCPYGGKGGWLSLWRGGGGLKAITWATPLLYRDPEVRADMESIHGLLSGIQHLAEIQKRVLEEGKMRAWLAAKGWPLEDIHGHAAKNHGQR